MSCANMCRLDLPASNEQANAAAKVVRHLVDPIDLEEHIDHLSKGVRGTRGLG